MNGKSCQLLNDRLYINGFRLLTELIAPVEVDMPPRDWGRQTEHSNPGRITLAIAVSQQVRQDSSVVIDDTVGQQSTTLTPDLLFVFRLESKFSKVGVGNGSTQLVIALPSIQRPLGILAMCSATKSNF